MRQWACPGLLAAVGFLFLGGVVVAAENDTAPKVVKVPALIEAIKQHKGKVVVVDCWNDG
jgi:hypothetical protein